MKLPKNMLMAPVYFQYEKLVHFKHECFQNKYYPNGIGKQIQPYKLQDIFLITRYS